jgi:ABC-2 type transport system permease protein
MAVYKRGYQRYQGPTNGQWARFMVLPRFAWQRIFQHRLILLLMVVAMIWPLLCAIFIYLTNHADLLKGMDKQFRDFIQVNGKFFVSFMNFQSTFAAIIAAFTGPGLIAPDLANNALPLYFSRPLSRLDYALGRLITLFGLLSLVTWVPGLLLFGIQVGMAGTDWLYANWRLGVGLVVGFAIWILLVSLVAMASSAYARMKAVSGGLVLGFFFLLSGLSLMVNGIFRVTWGNALSPSWVCERIWFALLGLDPKPGPGIVASASVLLLAMFLLAWIIERKLRPVEVIS